MNNGQIYAVTAMSCLFQLLIIYNRSVKTKYKETIDWDFSKLLIFCTLFCIIDSFWGICDSGYDFINFRFASFITYGYHIFCACSAFFWFGYISKYLKIKGTSKLFFKITRTIFILAQFTMLILNQFNREGFHYSSDMIYRTGRMRFFMYLVQFLYYISILAYSILHLIVKPYDRQHLYKNAVIFAFFPLIFGIGQYLFYDVALYSLGFTLSAFIIYTYNLTAIREQHLEHIAEKQKLDAEIDILTNVKNRRAYEKFQQEFGSTIPEKDFVFISMDLDELKKTNDDLGHAAGDEKIKGAASIMTSCFGEYGTIYRTGGDEFIGIIYADRILLEELRKKFRAEMKNWKGKISSSLHISAGFAAQEKYQNKTVREFEIIADKKMYQEKAIFYSSKGINRRGQAEAFTTMCELYKKILKINLTTDSFQILSMDTAEKNSKMGFSQKISIWLQNFGKSGQVHRDDLEKYLELTDINNLKEHFAQNRKSISIPYRRKDGNLYRSTIMEIIKAKDYSDQNQSLYLFVKVTD